MLKRYFVVAVFVISFMMISTISCSKKDDNASDKTITKEKELEKGNNADGSEFVIVKNGTKPTNPSFKYDFVEVGTIPFIGEDDSEERSFMRPSAVRIDIEGNIFIAGISTAKILKFTSDFKFVKSFGGKGPGPGEFAGGPSSMTYFNGKLLAPCYAQIYTNVYNTDGEFIKKIPPKIQAAFSGQRVFNNSIIMNVEERELKDDEALVTSSICLIDSNLSKIEKELFVHEKLSDNGVLPINDMYVRFAAGKEKLYVADVSQNFYKIFAYDTNYNKVMEIRKDYLSKEIKNPDARVYKFVNGLGGGFFKKSETHWKNKKFYYKSISFMFVDKNERLWVVSANKNSDIVGKEDAGLFVDIFEDGVFLNTIHLPFFKENDFTQVYFPLFMDGDKVFALDNDAECVRIFSY